MATNDFKMQHLLMHAGHWPLGEMYQMRDVCSREIVYVIICMVICTVTSYIALKHFKMLPPKLWKGSHAHSYHKTLLLES